MFAVTLAALVLIAVVLWDGFEAMLFPRRVSRSLRLARIFHVYSWAPWRAAARRMRPGKRRSTLLSVYGPLSVLGLFSTWAIGLIAGFALLHWSLNTELNPPGTELRLGTYFYLSGVTFFTLGFGDVTPAGTLGRAIAVTETGIGFAFLAVVISYLPVLYQAFSRREVTISLLDARAGSPPTAGQLLVRLARQSDFNVLNRILEEWERWSAELLESHLSFPILSFYRSQHDNQSWLAALTTMLDTSALVIVGIEHVDPYQAQMTFAMARHAAVDLCQTFQVPPIEPEADRLAAERLEQLRRLLRGAGYELRTGAAVDRKLAELRRMYEPFLNALSILLVLPIPPVLPEHEPVDNWQTSAWMQRTKGIGKLAMPDPGDDHVD
jgi:nitrate reductase NapE component